MEISRKGFLGWKFPEISMEISKVKISTLEISIPYLQLIFHSHSFLLDYSMVRILVRVRVRLVFELRREYLNPE